MEVQPYAFTTKSLYVGHTDYKYLRWQVIDTPGILDRPLEERNTIEMQSITALAHLRAAVLYVMDASEQCGYTLRQQASLFHSIKPLFANKPVLIVVNKVDATRLEDLGAEERAVLDEAASEAARISGGGLGGGDAASCLVTMSTLTEEGVSGVKQLACDRLLSSRVEVKLKSKRVHDIGARIHVAMPKVRDGAARPPVIPPSVLARRAAAAPAARRAAEHDLQEANGGAGVYNADLRKLYDLKDDAWRYDIMPEIVDGHNVLDFVDPDIDARLEALEREEEAAAAAFEAQDLGLADDHLTPEQWEDLRRIRERKKRIVADSRRKRTAADNAPRLPRTADADRSRTVARMRQELGPMGLDVEAAAANAPRSRSRGRSLVRKRDRSASTMDVDGDEKKRLHSSKSRSMSRGRSLSMAAPGARSGLKDANAQNRAIKMAGQ